MRTVAVVGLRLLSVGREEPFGMLLFVAIGGHGELLRHGKAGLVRVGRGWRWIDGWLLLVGHGCRLRVKKRSIGCGIGDARGHHGGSYGELVQGDGGRTFGLSLFVQTRGFGHGHVGRTAMVIRWHRCG